MSEHETQIYCIGETVETSELSPYNMTGTVVDVYEQNGFIYYVVTNSRGFTRILRTKDIKIKGDF